MSGRLAIGASLAGFVLLGCAGSNPPAREVTDTEAAIRAADEVGAAEIPSASLHLKLARDQLNEARQYIEDGEHEDARTILSRAQLDAELAIAEAHSAEAREEATLVQRRLDALRQRAQ
jgi:hypothetical protein